MNISRKSIAIIVAIIGAILILIFQMGLGSAGSSSDTTNQVQTDTPQLVSSDPVNDSTVAPNQKLKLNFNLPLENTAEFKYVIEPKKEVDLSLSDDRKTLTIIPRGGFELGQGYTLTIQSGTKFDGKKILGTEQVLHFKTIDYRGV